MKAVMPTVPPHLLQTRKESGADQWDEMWEGVLHMPPSPNREHQDFEWVLETWLRLHWAQPKGNRVYHQINIAPVGGWSHDYRIPDLVLLTPDRFHIDRNEYFEGAPTVVVEIHGPGDEAYEKLAFFAALGVPEAWILDRDTRRPEIHRLVDAAYQVVSADPDGWHESTATGIRMRLDQGKLWMRCDDESSPLS